MKKKIDFIVEDVTPFKSRGSQEFARDYFETTVYLPFKNKLINQSSSNKLRVSDIARLQI